MPPRDATDGPVRVASMNHLVPAPARYAWAVTAAGLLSYAQAGSLRLSGGQTPHPGKVSTLPAMVSVPGQPPTDTWPAECPVRLGNPWIRSGLLPGQDAQARAD